MSRFVSEGLVRFDTFARLFSALLLERDPIGSGDGLVWDARWSGGVIAAFVFDTMYNFQIGEK